MDYINIVEEIGIKTLCRQRWRSYNKDVM